MVYNQATQQTHATSHHAVAPAPSAGGLFAIIIACPSSHHHRQLAIRNHLPARPHRASDAYQLPNLGQLFRFDAQFLPWRNRLEKLEAVYGREQGYSFPALVSRASVSDLRRRRSHHYASRLGHRFDQKNPGQNGPGRKMPGKNRVRRIDELHRNTTDSGLQFFHPVDPQERRAMRNQRLDFASLDHLGLGHLGLINYDLLTLVWIPQTYPPEFSDSSSLRRWRIRCLRHSCHPPPVTATENPVCPASRSCNSAGCEKYPCAEPVSFGNPGCPLAR